MVPQAMLAQFTLIGKVVDATTQAPLAGAQVKANGVFTGAVTDAEGWFKLSVPTQRTVIEVTYLGYEKRVMSATAESPKVTVQMTEKAVELEDVTITASAPELIFEDKTLHLFDYGFSGDHLLVIRYDRALRRSVLSLVDEHDSIIDTELGPEAPGELVKDCLGNLHALGAQFACQLWVDKGQIEMYVDPRADFEKLVAPCVGNLDEVYYFDQYRFNNQILMHYAYNASSEEWYTFDEVKDNKKMHAMMDPLGIYRGIANTREQFMTISQEQWKEIGTWSPEFQFQQMVFFYPVDAPLRVIGDELFVFDHLNDELRRMDKVGKVKETLPIEYCNHPKWKREIFVDEVRQEAYTLYVRHGVKTLVEIDLKTGQTLGEYEIPFAFSHKPIVRDGVLYFLYKDSIYDDTNRLYRWAIK
jgi:hypothetical protein